ncbi:MAG: AMP-binding protein [Deltaproteobacteria bacterium]
MNEKTIPEFLGARVKKYAGKLLLQRKDGWSWKQTTWLDFDSEIKNVAAFLMSLGFGAGDKALITAPRRAESLMAELAVVSIGGAVVSVGGDDSDIQSAAALFSPKFIFASSDASLQKILALPKASLPDRVVPLFDTTLGEGGELVVPYKAVVKFGMLKKKRLQDELEQAAKSLSPDSAAFIFPHGGASKSEFSHRKLIDTLSGASERISALDLEAQAFSYLQTASPFDALINLAAISKAARLIVAESRKGFYDDILEVKPTVIFEAAPGLREIASIAAGDRLKWALGGRARIIATDFAPEPAVRAALQRAGISTIEIPELSGL